MFTCVAARSVEYYLAGPGDGAGFQYYGSKQGVWWFPSNACAATVEVFAGCADGEPVDPNTFRHLAASGQLPDGARVGRSGLGVRMPGFDCHFAPPKSVSLIFVFSDEKLRERILQLHVEGVRRALQFLFDWGLMSARRGNGGKIKEALAGMGAAVFTEFASRDNDPQLHSHAYIPNIGIRQDGTIGAIDNYLAKVFQLLVGAVYQAHIAAGLVQLGFSLAPDGHAFRVSEVPSELVRIFSKRRTAIERIGKERGIDVSRDRSAADHIARESRPSKMSELSVKQLERHWRAQLEEAGYGQSEFVTPTHKNVASDTSPLSQHIDEAIAQAFANDAVLRKPKLLANVAERLIGKCSVHQLEWHLQHSVPKKVIALPGNFSSHNTPYTTRSILEKERTLREIALRGRQLRQFAPKQAIEAAIEARPSLSEEQRHSVRHALNNDQIAITEGSAGSGKSFKLAAVADVSRAAGLDVWALAPSWSASQVLAKDTATPDTRRRALARFMKELEVGKIALSPDTVVLLDEAGMVGTDDLYSLVCAVREAGCKLVLSGDTMQLAPVAAGAPMRLLVEALGSSRMSEIRRQTLPWSRAASMQFAAGRTIDALRIYEARDNIDWIRGQRSCLAALADQYMADLAVDLKRTPHALPSCLAIAARNADVDILNAEIRSRLQGAGLVAAADIGFDVAVQAPSRTGKLEKGRINLAVGDRIVFGETVELAEFTIRNSDVARILAIEPGAPPQVTLLFEGNGEQVTCRTDQLVGFRLPQDPRIPLVKHAYASTVHFSQGLTVDRAYVANTCRMSREAVYVAMTRHRHVARLFVDTSRFKVADPIGLVGNLLKVLGPAERQEATQDAQVVAAKEAFFEECARPGRKANASDYVTDVDDFLVAQGSSVANRNPTRSLDQKVATLLRMVQRSERTSGEAASFVRAPGVSAGRRSSVPLGKTKRSSVYAAIANRLRLASTALVVKFRLRFDNLTGSFRQRPPLPVLPDVVHGERGVSAEGNESRPTY